MTKYSKKAQIIVEETWDYLESNYKGSEITLSLLIYTIQNKCDTENCRKQALKFLWDTYEWYDLEEKAYYKEYYKECLGLRV